MNEERVKFLKDSIAALLYQQNIGIHDGLSAIAAVLVDIVGRIHLRFGPDGVIEAQKFMNKQISSEFRKLGQDGIGPIDETTRAIN